MEKYIDAQTHGYCSGTLMIERYDDKEVALTGINKYIADNLGVKSRSFDPKVQPDIDEICFILDECFYEMVTKYPKIDKLELLNAEFLDGLLLSQERYQKKQEEEKPYILH